MSVKHLLTDRQILGAIYHRHYSDYIAFDNDSTVRQTKQYVPVDVPAIAKELRGDPELIFGRLYYHLDAKYGRYDVTPTRPFFQIAIPPQNGKMVDLKVVNFPVLESALATLELESRRTFIPIVLSSLSLAISLMALVWSHMK